MSCTQVARYSFNPFLRVLYDRRALTRTCRRGCIRLQRSTSPAPHDHLSPIPHHQQHWWITRLFHKRIDTARSISHRLPSERGLVIPLAQKVRIDDGREERVLESDGTKEDTEEDDEFSVCDDFHSLVIVGCRVC